MQTAVQLNSNLYEVAFGTRKSIKFQYQIYVTRRKIPKFNPAAKRERKNLKPTIDGANATMQTCESVFRTTQVHCTTRQTPAGLLNPDPRETMQNAQALLEALRQTYIRDLPSQLDELESLILERGPEADSERWQELYRRIHSLKGSGGTYGLHAISDICHPFEDLIASSLSGTDLSSAALTDFALRYLDLLRETTLHYQQQLPVDEQLPARLQRLNNAISATHHSALIVENSDVVINLISDVLSHFHFRVEVARDGYLALGRVLSGSFDLVVTGMETGRLNGHAMISAARLAESRRQTTRFVLVTASGFNTPLAEGDAVFHKDSLLRENLFRHLRDMTLAKNVL